MSNNDNPFPGPVVWSVESNAQSSNQSDARLIRGRDAHATKHADRKGNQHFISQTLNAELKGGTKKWILSHISESAQSDKVEAV